MLSALSSIFTKRLALRVATVAMLHAEPGVMEKSGMRFAGRGDDPHAPDGIAVIRYEIATSDSQV